ncbi:MAG: NAD(+) synthase [Chitinispirillales bacterium]|jgi:NAD+ synthase|nr:NAD(+) synthase [Chitinispirillales bacterium]
MGATKNIEQVTEECVAWIRNWFNENGNTGTRAIIGISGGKDSAVVAALCVKALGQERVVGVMMPNGEQPDFEDAENVIKHLRIPSLRIDISQTIKSIESCLTCDSFETHTLQIKYNDDARINIPPRVRMTYLYALASCLGNSRVANCGNASERFIGYSTKFGDAAGDFYPITDMTCSEVIAMGKYLGLPDQIMDKAPADGLCGKTDEENFGFTYEQLDDFILCGRIYGDKETDSALSKRIMDLHKTSRHKYREISRFMP